MFLEEIIKHYSGDIILRMLMSKRKFINVLGLFIALVLCWKLTWCQTKERTLKIGLFIDEKNTRLQTALLQLVSNFTNDFYDMYTGGIKLDIDVIFISEEPISRIPSLFCSRILKRQVTAIITHTTSAKKTQFIASLASHFCIPVVGTITDNPLLSERVSILAYLYFKVEFLYKRRGS